MKPKPPAGGQCRPPWLKDYIKTGGVICPWCKGSDGLQVDASPVHLGPEFVYPVEHHLSCLSCGKRWKDLYQLVTVEER